MKHATVSVALAAVLLGGLHAEPAISTQVLFEKPRSEGEFRIPGLVVLEDGTVLAFCADRKGRGDFGHDTTTVLRRSLDGGKTWEPLRETTAKPGADIHSGPVVQDRETGRIFKFCRFWPAEKDAKQFTNAKTHTEMTELGWIDHLQTSDDSGTTWTPPHPIVLDFPEGAVTAATGNGIHGIQLGDGRLLIQGGYSERQGDGKLLRRCCVFSSADGGMTWKRSQNIDTAEIDTLREFTLTERQDGSFICNIRSKRGQRAIFEGDTLSADDELGDIECHAGMTSFNGRWFFTHPNPLGKKREGSFNQRRQRICLRISRDEGESWPEQIVIHEKAAAYSDVAVTADGTVLVLFENGDRIGDCYQRISLARLSLSP